MKKLISFGIILPAGVAAMLILASCGGFSGDEAKLAESLLDFSTVYLFEIADATECADFDADDDGNARPELDALAESAYAGLGTDLGCTNFRAFITVSDTDTIRTLGIPAQGQVMSGEGFFIGDNLGDILDGDIDRSLENAGVTTGTNYWTGSKFDGSLMDGNCSGWTVGTADGKGQYGLDTATNAGWLSEEKDTCDQKYGLLGVCW